MPNTALLNRTLNYIEAHPEQWDQSQWAARTICGTVYCFAGTAVVLCGLPLAWRDSFQEDLVEFADNIIDEGEVGDTIATMAAVVLAVSPDQAARLFDPLNTLADLRRLVAELTASEPALDTVAGA